MKKLQVPENISLRWELWKGFGKAELIPSAIITAFSILIAILIYRIHPAPGMELFIVIGVIFVMAFCVGLFGKLENNQSIYDYLKRQFRYSKEQQAFWYCKSKEEEVCAFVEENEET